MTIIRPNPSLECDICGKREKLAPCNYKYAFSEVTTATYYQKDGPDSLTLIDKDTKTYCDACFTKTFQKSDPTDDSINAILGAWGQIKKLY